MTLDTKALTARILMYMFDDSKEEVFSCEIDVTNEYFDNWEITYIKTSD